MFAAFSSSVKERSVFFCKFTISQFLLPIRKIREIDCHDDVAAAKIRFKSTRRGMQKLHDCLLLRFFPLPPPRSNRRFSPPSPPKKRSRRQDNFSPCRDFAVSLLPLLLLHPSKSPSSSSSSSNQTFPRGAARKKGATFARFYKDFLSPFSGQTFYFRVLRWLQMKKTIGDFSRLSCGRTRTDGEWRGGLN